MVWGASVALGCGGAGQQLTEVRRLSDPAGDDYGPGTYRYPQSDVYRPGALDLRTLTLSRHGDSLVIEAAFEEPIVVAQGVRLAREQVADLFIATVDIYLDLDGKALSGERDALPGRRVRLGDAMGWELAVVLSPIPSRLKSALSDYADAGKLVVPNRVQRRGKVLKAKVPWRLLQGSSLEQIGVAVTVTGTVFGSTFRGGVDGMLPSAFVREVSQRLGRCERWEEDWDGAPCTFGGCGTCDGHPRVIDALASDAGIQEAALGRWRTLGAGQAELPITHGEKAPSTSQLEPSDAGQVAPPDARRGVIVDQRSSLVTFKVASGALPPLGHLLQGRDSSGAPVATMAMVKTLLGGESPLGVAEIISGDVAQVVIVTWE